MEVAASKGRIKRSQGTKETISILKLESGEILDLGGLPQAVESDDQRETHGDFRSGHGDDEKNEDLAVVDLVSVRDMKAAEGDDGQVRGLQHHFERHIYNKQVAANDDA